MKVLGVFSCVGAKGTKSYKPGKDGVPTPPVSGPRGPAPLSFVHLRVQSSVHDDLVHVHVTTSTATPPGLAGQKGTGYGEIRSRSFFIYVSFFLAARRDSARPRSRDPPPTGPPPRARPVVPLQP